MESPMTFVGALQSNLMYAFSLFIVWVTTEFGPNCGHGTCLTPSLNSKVPTTRPVTFKFWSKIRAWTMNPLNKRGPNMVSFRALSAIDVSSPAWITFDSSNKSTGFSSGLGWLRPCIGVNVSQACSGAPSGKLTTNFTQIDKITNLKNILNLVFKLNWILCSWYQLYLLLIRN